MVGNSLNLLKNNDPHIWMSSRINTKRSKNWYTVVKMLKIKGKEKILNTARKKKKQLITYNETLIILTDDFSAKTVEHRKAMVWRAQSALKKEILQESICIQQSKWYPISFNNESEVKISPSLKEQTNKTKLGESVAIRQA